MANQEHLDILNQGVEVWNQWKREHAEIRPDLYQATLNNVDLSGADFSTTILSEVELIRVNLTGANLYQADLSDAIFYQVTLGRANLSLAHLNGADLSGAILCEADLRITDIRRANLSDVDLRQADLSGATLTGTSLRRSLLRQANFSGADLSGVDFYHTDFSETDLSHASLQNTLFVGVDLRTIKGLGTVKHEGPSVVDMTTVVLSQGQIPVGFLRGVGVPDVFIDFIPSLVGVPIQYYSCFISYSSADQDFAIRLYADLQNNGIRCWFAPEDLKIGDKIRPRIDEAIHLYDKVLLVLSRHSIASQWVEQEVESALAKERKEGRIVLFPIRLDKAVMEIKGGWPALIRNTRTIGDFTRWKRHDAYQKALERLLRDLKAEA